MGAWDLYENRINARGGSRKGSIKRNEILSIQTKLPQNLSYCTVPVDDIEQDVAIINSDNLNEKVILSMPGEDIRCGALVHFMDNYWLVNERDANTTLYTRAKLLQCNHLLRWVSDDGELHEQWCVIEDGTKLKRLRLRDSLAYWKRYVKITPLIAGNSLEPFGYSTRMKYA